MQSERFKVGGMTCVGCVGKVTDALRCVDGVHDLDVSLAEGEVVVRFDERKTSLTLLKAIVASVGYGVVPVDVIYHPVRSEVCG